MRSDEFNVKTTGLRSIGETYAGTSQECSETTVRIHMRYPIHAPVTFSWLARNGAQRQGKGRSRNLSEGGAFILARNLPRRCQH